VRDSDKRCQQFYQDQYAKYLQCYTPGEALNECLHDFLDQRPSGKYSSRNRAAGLASAQFWWASETVAEADLASLALARVLHFDDVIDIDLLSHLATHNADQLRWAVRYSKLFTRRDSPLWVHLRKSCAGLQWQTFIDEQKSQLLWCYWMRRAIETFAASELAGKLIGSTDNHEANQLAYIKTIRSQLYLQVVFGLGERVRLNNGAEVTLFHAMLASELTRAFFEQAYLQPYQRYLDESGEPITALGRLAFEGLLQGENRFPMTWSEQPEKIQRIRAWTVSDDHPDGDPEAAKAILQFWTSDLQTLSEQVKQPPNLPTPRLSEKPFYKIGRYSFQFPWVAGRQNSLSAAVNNLRRVEQRRSELRSETERIEHNLAHSLRQRGFHVVVGYEPRRVDAQDAGEIDLLACLAGVILLLEVKSGFIRSTQQEVWLHRTNTLRKAARQLRRKSVAVRQALQHDLGLRAALGLAAPDPLPTLHGWVVDTSIEFDGEVVDGFRIVSREVIELALRDELHYLKALDKQGANEVATLYPEGFSASAFARIIEQSEVWKEL